MNRIASLHTTFSFDAYRFDPATGEVILTYSLDDTLSFTERFVFPLPSTPTTYDPEELDRALFALHLACGISYYKAFLPPTLLVRSGSLTQNEADFWNKLFSLGLGEFFYKNGLDSSGYIQFPVDTEKKSTPLPQQHQKTGALLPIGGGKDSLVATQLLEHAHIPFDLISLGRHERIAAVAQSLQRPLAVIERTLDPQLFAHNAHGAWNGHVPISSLIAFASVVVAILQGKRDIILANERSASVGNLVVNGREINHQYSKSLEFERDIQTFLATAISPDVRYFSLLRPLSELGIVKKFVDANRHVDVFSSCNKNFKLSGVSPASRWCGACAKCAFVFALFAAFLPPERLEEIFGSNFFADASLAPTYRDLLGHGAEKPFDCVGEPEEVLAAFALAQRSTFFDTTPIMQWFTAEILPHHDDLDANITNALTPSPAHTMPEEYLPIAYAD